MWLFLNNLRFWMECDQFWNTWTSVNCAQVVKTLWWFLNGTFYMHICYAVFLGKRFNRFATWLKQKESFSVCKSSRHEMKISHIYFLIACNWSHSEQFIHAFRLLCGDLCQTFFNHLVLSNTSTASSHSDQSSTNQQQMD